MLCILCDSNLEQSIESSIFLPFPLIPRGDVLREPEENTLVESRCEWELLYTRERAALMVELKGLVEEIHHVGSTAVPHLAARPILDILITLRDPNMIGRCIGQLERLGYERIEGEGPFVAKRRTHPPCRIAILIEGHPRCREMILFRDMLRSDPKLRCRYELLRLDILKRCSYDPSMRREVKEEFMRSAIGCKKKMAERP